MGEEMCRTCGELLDVDVMVYCPCCGRLAEGSPLGGEADDPPYDTGDVA